MADPNDPPSWWHWISPFFSTFIIVGYECYKKMQTWEKPRRRQFLTHVTNVIIGIAGVALVLQIYSGIPVDFVAIYLGLINNFEQAYVPASLNSVVIGLGMISSWLIFSESKSSFRIIKNCAC